MWWLYSEKSEVLLELLVRRTETEEDIYRHQQWIRFPGGFVLQLQVPVHKIRFATGTISIQAAV